MGTPLVSIIIPAYNAEKTIERALASCRRQTCGDLEILAVNDGSRDRTEELIRACAAEDGRIRLISTENRGVSHARNTGLDQASGEYILFLDADDELPDDGVRVLLDQLLENKADIASGAFRLSRDAEYSAGDGVSGIWQGNEALENALHDHPRTYAVWAKLYTAEIIGDTRFNEALKVNEDSLFLFHICRRQPVMVLTDRVVYVFTAPQGAGWRLTDRCSYGDVLAAVAEKQKVIAEYYPQYADQSVEIQLKANMAILRDLVRCRGDHRGIEKQCIEQIRRDRACFVPASRNNRIWFAVIMLHLYYPFKFACRVMGLLRR